MKRTDSLTLAAMSLGYGVVQLDVTIVNTALNSNHAHGFIAGARAALGISTALFLATAPISLAARGQGRGRVTAPVCEP